MTKIKSKAQRRAELGASRGYAKLNNDRRCRQYDGRGNRCLLKARHNCDHCYKGDERWPFKGRFAASHTDGDMARRTTQRRV